MPELMKGNVWAKRKDAKKRDGTPVVQYPVWVEPKIDEIRLHVKLTGHGVQFLSYAGKPLYNLGSKFAQGLRAGMQEYGLSELDCGVQVNGNFNDTYRWVRSTRIPEDLENSEVALHVYDAPTRTDVPYAVRVQLLQKVVRSLREWQEAPVFLLRSMLCYTPEEVDAEYAIYRELGYEGAMVKDPRAVYSRGKRTDAWLKMKPEEDADGVITGFTEAICGTDQPELGLRVGDRLGRVGSVDVRLEDGSVASPHGIPHALGEDMLKHPEKYLGQWCEFHYMERDRQGGYRHPTFYRLREAKA